MVTDTGCPGGTAGTAKNPSPSVVRETFLEPILTRTQIPGVAIALRGANPGDEIVNKDEPARASLRRVLVVTIGELHPEVISSADLAAATRRPLAGT